ncbi:glycine betaine ABC transporter substrate-binding protein [Virgibacillus sp. W0181]|uniref:glycine betaine ABC transporter substrate-binding protein n=1 Tax=Virgibacillus sp. W0181 TaxID=3391581 RepID=UPI003F473CE2
MSKTLNWKRLVLLVGFGLLLTVFAACGSNNDSNSGDTGSDENAEESGDNANSEEGSNVGEELDYKITGIEAGAGVFKATEKAVEEYGLDGWEVQASSSGAMATALGEAIEKEEPIIVTGWTPHWKFSKYDLKYLEDPKGVYGEAETINTIVRQGLEDDMPNAYKLLDQFEWTTDDMESIMLEIQNGADPSEAAATWVEENADKVDEWKDGVEEVDGEEIELVYVEWDSEIASTNVVGKVLEDLGYSATITPLDNAVMWQAVANSEVDGMVAAWLPATHEDLYAEYKEDIVDLGPNLEGAKIGAVVPSYMDIESLEELEAK